MEITEDRDFAQFVKKIKELTSIDLNQYKEAQMKRRLTTLRMKKGFSSFGAFYDAIAGDKRLLYEFLDRMTINVSEFWRNPNRWEVLQTKFLPEMRRRHTRVKCWSAACSTGEEPYTLSMILADLGAQGEVQITATDIDEGALEKARQGTYPDRSVRDVPAAMLARYFRKEGSEYRVTEELKKPIRFQKQNLLTDRFEPGQDLIICRNVMIYFTEEAKQLLYHKFSDALKPGGILFVGSTEQIFTPGQYGLEPADTFFYRKL
ncbi:protein-glutamate O-methyltransferase CheR [Paenibacillus aurantius]|uniref:protein-glutamate O-methyltransferase n=1 Tax=Paenibacillus aurantius TaxID=2918900 RepID=A0AA96RD14_9BACL|nr:protein-glutamate O-methyltransferase CheR [Paenibacillus aurantius]WNQ09282.1 protein-glutamate O-methyltransferase CheR [Paenibacillus aurantius]